MARNVREIAWRAQATYGPEGSIGRYTFYVEEAWREFVRDAGGFYRQTMETSLVDGQREYAMPTTMAEVIEVRIQNADGSVVLEKTEREELTILPETEATDGVPSYFYIPDPRTIAIEPVSDGTYDELRVEFFADVPDSLDLDDTDGLPVPAWVERGLIGYAAYYAAGYEPGLKNYQDTLVAWRREASRKQMRNF